MKFIAEEIVLDSLEYFIEFDARFNTFLGLIALFKNGTLVKNDYLVTNMVEFSKDLDQILSFKEETIQRNGEKTWYTLFQKDWVEGVKRDLLKNQKIDLEKASVLYFWNFPFEKSSDVIERFKDCLPDFFIEEFFSEDSISISLSDKPADKSFLYEKLNGEGGKFTLSLDNGSFISKTPGDLSGAPFSQTLYANTNLKKYFSIYDFDFLNDYGLETIKFDTNKKKLNFTVSDKLLRNFAYKVFELFYGDDWLNSVINSSDISEGKIGKNKFNRLKFGPFVGLLGEFSSKQTKESLTSGFDLRFLEAPIYINNEKFYYFTTQWNGAGDYPLSYENLKSFFETQFDCEFLYEENVYSLLLRKPHINYKHITLPKPFVLLAGISGTGKTRFVREQALAHKVGSENFCLVPVRPDWHEPSDLLGYVSRIGKTPEYVSTKVLQFIIKAWSVIAPNADANGMGELNLTSPPYWLCLDEMNLAPVEQYFADYLSVLESREFKGCNYTCDPLLDSSVLKTKDANVRSDLGLANSEDLWNYFVNHGISIPPNLIVAGTVNMDETTHGFSRKVIDRALTIDFGEFFPNNYSKIFGEQNIPKTFTYSLNSQITREAINCKSDPSGDKTIAFLQSINDVLKDTPFELAYRALNELLLHVCSFAPDDDASLQAVWDDFLMTKILPRIDGDDDKLRYLHGDDQENILVKLNEVVSQKLSHIWSADKGRIDLFRDQHDGAEIVDIPCRSRKKIQWMKDRLDRNTFTSYWP